MTSSPFTIPQSTIDAQRRASDPSVSAWVAANAGAGKTKVLVDRVVRLLLAGTPPARILCLTFTKAAAANMSLRVINLLSQWVTISDTELRKVLEELEGRRVGRQDLAKARRLFARAVETPGGLKIETIHAFCERILHLAPFEAGVPAQFTVIEETAVSEMITQATEKVLSDALEQADHELTGAYKLVSQETGRDQLMEAVSAALTFLPTLEKHGGYTNFLKALRATLGLYPQDTMTTFQRKILDDGWTQEQHDEIRAALRKGKKTDEKRADALEAFQRSSLWEEKWKYLSDIFFDANGLPRKDDTIVTKGIDPEIREQIIHERDRISILRDQMRSMEALERTEALFFLSIRIHAAFTEAKTRKSALDFDDLIRRTLELLEHSDTAWVLYKLDRGIDHILIDEAQDTSPEQWSILRRLTEEFSVGQGVAGNKPRTVFAVGDPKQSIYSFQGADPREFETSRRSWSKRARDAFLAFENIQLTLSFRTASAVLTAVDATFQIAENYTGLSFEDNATGTVHASARQTSPGQVELWPVEEAQDTIEPEAGLHPVDAPEPDSAPLLLAKRIAQAIKTWIDTGDENGRHWRAKDILILVRKRGTAFEAVIRALKLEEIPVAGQDRLNISDHIAVMDLVSVGRAALLPDDDLSLAEALKSPLVGWTDEDLERIAGSRTDSDSLAAALQSFACKEDVAAQKGLKELELWQKLARHHGPFGFYAMLLGSGEARAKLVARLGHEAADAIDAFLSAARTAEFSETPSLASFLSRFEETEHVIKRDLETQRDEVRVMTVHGAKGLEASLVIVMDGGDALGRDPPLLSVSSPLMHCPLPLWVPFKKDDSTFVQNIRRQWHAKQLEEHHRLLYVAMTRAKDRLVIAPYASGKTSQTDPNAWSEMIRRGLEAHGETLHALSTPYGEVEIWRDDLTVPVHQEEKNTNFSFEDATPDWLFQTVPPESEPLPPVRPSHMNSSDIIEPKEFRQSSARARIKGNLIHSLLEHIPYKIPENWSAAAMTFLSARVPSWSDADKRQIIAQVSGIIHEERLAPFFSEYAKSETAISGNLSTDMGVVPVSGRVDRLAVGEETVFIADFKSTPRIPQQESAISQNHILQLALYRALLQQIFPEKEVRAFLVYTAGPTLWELSLTTMDTVLQQFLHKNIF